jgi:hypothetical protein
MSSILNLFCARSRGVVCPSWRGRPNLNHRRRSFESVCGIAGAHTHTKTRLVLLFNDFKTHAIEGEEMTIGALVWIFVSSIPVYA